MLMPEGCTPPDYIDSLRDDQKFGAKERRRVSFATPYLQRGKCNYKYKSNLNEFSNRNAYWRLLTAILMVICGGQRHIIQSLFGVSRWISTDLKGKDVQHLIISYSGTFSARCRISQRSLLVGGNGRVERKVAALLPSSPPPLTAVGSSTSFVVILS